MLICEEINFNIHALAKRMNRTVATIQSYAKGTSQPRADFFTDLLEIFPNLNLYWYFTDIGEITMEKEEIAKMKRELESYKKIVNLHDTIEKLNDIVQRQEIEIHSSERKIKQLEDRLKKYEEGKK